MKSNLKSDKTRNEMEFAVGGDGVFQKRICWGLLT